MKNDRWLPGIRKEVKPRADELPASNEVWAVCSRK